MADEIPNVGDMVVGDVSSIGLGEDLPLGPCYPAHEFSLESTYGTLLPNP